MTDQSPPTGVRLRALLLADHIYRDHSSGKYVISGTFFQLTVAAVPITFARTIGIFVSLSGLTGNTDIDIEFVDTSNGEVLMQTRPLEIFCENPHMPVEFAMEVPPLPLPRMGRYIFRLLANDTLVGTASVFVRTAEENG